MHLILLRIAALISIVASACPLYGERPAAPPLPELASEPIRFTPMISAARVRPHIEHLASEELQGRRGPFAAQAARYLKDEFQKLRLKPLFGTKFFQPIPGPKAEDGTQLFYGQNVGAWLPGSDPKLRDEYVIVSAHYDHLGKRNGVVFRGADDNASGTSMMLEVAAEFCMQTPPPKRSLVFIGFDLEEHLLWGSRWFAAHPPWPLKQVRLFTTADMIGRSLGNLPIATVFVLGSEHGTGLSETLDTVGIPEGLNVARMGIDLIGTRSDYGPFRDRRIPFLFFSTGEHPDYHKPSDIPERIDYEQVARVSSLVYRITGSVANSDQAPVWNADVQPQLAEVRSVHRIAELLLDADAGGKETGAQTLNGIQRFIVKQAEVQTRQILERGRMTPAERSGLIRTAQVLLLSVF